MDFEFHRLFLLKYGYNLSSGVAEERGERLGQTVGYQIRLESVIPSGANGSSILFCTTGIVLQWMIKAPEIRHVTHLIGQASHQL